MGRNTWAGFYIVGVIEDIVFLNLIAAFTLVVYLGLATGWMFYFILFLLAIVWFQALLLGAYSVLRVIVLGCLIQLPAPYMTYFVWVYIVGIIIEMLNTLGGTGGAPLLL